MHTLQIETIHKPSTETNCAYLTNLNPNKSKYLPSGHIDPQLMAPQRANLPGLKGGDIPCRIIISMDIYIIQIYNLFFIMTTKFYYFLPDVQILIPVHYPIDSNRPKGVNLVGTCPLRM